MVASGGFGRVLATQRWHCQGFLAFATPSPLRIGTARDFRRLRSLRHPGLAVPGIAGSLARFSGTARDYWRGAGFRHPVLALPGIAGLRPLRSPRAPRPHPRSVTELSFDPNASS